MRHRTPFTGLCAVLLALSCMGVASAQGTTASLYGKWKLDNEKTFKAMQAEDGHDVVTAFVGDDAFSLVYEFQSNGAVKSDARVTGTEIEHSRSGAWKVLGEKDGALTLKTEFDDASDKERGRISVRFLDENTIRIDDLDVKKDSLHVMILQRVATKTRVGK